VLIYNTYQKPDAHTHHPTKPQQECGAQLLANKINELQVGYWSIGVVLVSKETTEMTGRGG